MRANRSFRGRSYEWLVLILSVGISLVMLFFSRHTGVIHLRGELADGLGAIVAPVASLSNIVSRWQEYEELHSLAIELSLENSILRDAIFENERLRAMLEFKRRSSLELTPASIIARLGPAAGGRLRLNVGAADSVSLDAAVLTPHGLVGKVIELSDQTSLVQTLVGNSYGVSVIVERTRMAGIMRWRGSNDWAVIGLPTGAKLKVGDVVVSSGAGFVFPKGIRTGIISSAQPTPAAFGQTWSVEPLVDFSTLEEVFVVLRQAPSDTSAVLDSAATGVGS